MVCIVMNTELSSFDWIDSLTLLQSSNGKKVLDRNLISDSQKWSKGKVRDTVDNKVYFEKADYDKLLAEVPKVSRFVLVLISQMKPITVYTIVDRLKMNGSCARAGIRELVKQGKIVEVSKRGHYILTRKSLSLCLLLGSQ